MSGWVRVTELNLEKLRSKNFRLPTYATLPMQWLGVISVAARIMLRRVPKVASDRSSLQMSATQFFDLHISAIVRSPTGTRYDHTRGFVHRLRHGRQQSCCTRVPATCFRRV